jgi:hypothetical protein
MHSSLIYQPPHPDTPARTHALTHKLPTNNHYYNAIPTVLHALITASKEHTHPNTDKTDKHNQEKLKPNLSCSTPFRTDLTYAFMTLSNKVGSRPTDPPRIEFRTFRLKFSIFLRKSSAASLFNGSDGFGSRNKYYLLARKKGEEGCLKTVDDGVEVEDRFPIFTKNVETNIACCIDVGMINLRVSTCNTRDALFEYSGLWEVDEGIHFRRQRRSGMNRLCTCLAFSRFQ